MCLLPPLPSPKIKSMPLGRQESEKYKYFARPTKSKVDVQDIRMVDDTTRNSDDVRRERAFLLYKRMGSPTRTEFKRQVAADESINITPEDIDLLSWNMTGKVVNLKKMNALLTIKVEEENKRRRDERRLKREVENKSMPEVDVQDKRMADATTCNSKDVRRKRAFLWYKRMGKPTRTEFKRLAAAYESINITPRDIDLLPWNWTGRVVNIEKMNAMIKPAS